MATVEIYKDAETILRLKAYELQIPESVILDAMIREFSPSSPVSILEQQDRLKRECEEFIAEYPDATIEQAFRRGHHRGWTNYQLRKPDTFIRLIQAYKRETNAPR